MIQLLNDIGLIGDLVNTIPVMIDLAKKHDGLRVEQGSPEGNWIYDLIPKEYNVEIISELTGPCLFTDLSAAFEFGSVNDVHMSQCHHHLFYLPTPPDPIRPVLNIPDAEVPIYDYIFAPFSRSLPDDQKWSIHKWQELGWKLEQQGFSVCIFGNSKYDHRISDLKNEYDRPMVEVLNMIKKANKGVVSVVTGISHLAYAMNTKNYLLINQGSWGRNPDAICIETFIPRITVEEVLKLINEN